MGAYPEIVPKFGQHNLGQIKTSVAHVHLSARPFRAENGLWLSGDAVVPYGLVRPSVSRAGVARWALHCCLPGESARISFAGLPGSSPDGHVSGIDR
jgi:hypothetical protein